MRARLPPLESDHARGLAVGDIAEACVYLADGGRWRSALGRNVDDGEAALFQRRGGVTEIKIFSPDFVQFTFREYSSTMFGKPRLDLCNLGGLGFGYPSRRYEFIPNASEKLLAYADPRTGSQVMELDAIECILAINDLPARALHRLAQCAMSKATMRKRSPTTKSCRCLAARIDRVNG